MVSMASQDTTQEAVARYVQERLRAETKERGSAAKIARATKTSTAHVSNAKNWASVGPDFAEAMAKYWGMTYAELILVATGQVEAPAPVPDSVVERNMRYPNLMEAVRFWRVSGGAEEAVEEALSIAAEAAEDPSPMEWLDQLKAISLRLKFQRKAPLDAQREREADLHGQEVLKKEAEEYVSARDEKLAAYRKKRQEQG